MMFFISSMSLEEYQIHVHSVLQRLLENCLYVVAEKCEFHSSLISFPGYILAGGQTPEGAGGKKKSHSHISKPSSAFSWIC